MFLTICTAHMRVHLDARCICTYTRQCVNSYMYVIVFINVHMHFKNIKNKNIHNTITWTP